MSSKTRLSTNAAAAAAGPYSQGIRFGEFLFISGQLPIDPKTGLVPSTVEEQTRQSLASVKAVLEAGGGSLDTILKTTVFLKDMNDFAKMNAVYAEHFGEVPPARSTVEVARLPRDVLVEIEAIAFSSSGIDR